MSRKAIPLSDAMVRNAKPREKDYRLYDGDCLYLIIRPTGVKLWRSKYRYQEKENSLSLGAYPEVSLTDARQLNKEIRKQVLNGVNPSTVRKEGKAREKAGWLAVDNKQSVRVSIDENMIEIWKGRSVVRLNKEESLFITDLLIRMR